MALFYLSPIHKASRQIGIYFEGALKGSGLSPFEGHLLSYLRSYAPCALSDIHRVFGMKRSTLTSVFDRMEERGLISRETLAQDRRSFLIRLTRRGTTAANQVQRCVEALEAAISKGVTKSDLEGFRQVMSSIAVATQTSAKPAAPAKKSPASGSQSQSSRSNRSHLLRSNRSHSARSKENNP